MAMMAKQQPASKEKPCKGLTLDCIAAMGCVVPLMAADLTGSIAAPHIHGKPNFWSATNVLAGKNFAPDPDPPMKPGWSNDSVCSARGHVASDPRHPLLSVKRGRASCRERVGSYG